MFCNKRGYIFAVFALVAIFFTNSSAYAQCEVPGVAAGTAAAAISAQGAAVTAVTTALVAPATGAIDVANGIANQAIILAMNTGWDVMRARLNRFWNDWMANLKGMAKQDSASMIDQTRQMASNFDTSSINEAAKRLQVQEYETKIEYIPTEQGCRFDTTAKYLSKSTAKTKAVSQGFNTDLRNTGLNKTGTQASAGRAAYNAARFQSYKSKFCDPSNNAGKAACAVAGAAVDANVLPGKTLFAKETIDMSDANVRAAVDELTRNITGFEVADPMTVEAMDRAAGREQRQINRQNLAQMDAVTSLVTAVVGERTPGEAAPEVQAVRQRQGVGDASSKPSEREIRQKIIEELWDPDFYAKLGEDPSTISKKKLYLSAYNLMLAYKMVDRMERIALAQSIQTANMLKSDAALLNDVSGAAPKR